MAGSGVQPASPSNRDNRLPANATREWIERDAAGHGLPDLTRESSNPEESSVLTTGHVLRRRRSSVAERMTALGDLGGVNSLNNFARSWTRAAGFHEFTDGRHSIRLQPDLESQHDGESLRASSDHPARAHRSLLRAALEHDGRAVSESPLEDDSSASLLGADPPPEDPIERRIRQRRSSLQQDGLLQIDPALNTTVSGSYGSFLSRRSASSLRPSRTVIAPVQTDDPSILLNESAPLLTKSDGDATEEHFNLVVGGSTVPQTIFNSVNTLIGVGMLSLPLAMKYSGWVFGLGFFLFASITTSYTARLLAKCMDVDGSLITFADLAYVSFGTKARIATSVLFCLELVGACVALVMLFADSMNALVGPLSVTDFKIICGVILIPLAFVPLRFLSFSSFLGILCCGVIVVAIFIDGMIKTEAPGSLRDPSRTFAFPADWRTMPLAFGLLMAPWGGHGVFPNIYRDMRHPARYGTSVNVTYLFTIQFSIEITITVMGYVMFGDDVHDEVTSNIFLTSGYPRWLSYVIAIAICIIPLTKTPLNARPIYSTIEFFLGLGPKKPVHVIETPEDKRSAFVRATLVVLTRVLTTVVFVVFAILVPGFDRVMALLGSLACSLVCIVLPCSFHLRIFAKQLNWKQKALDWSLIILFLLLGTVGTICACLPKRMLGVED